MRVLVTGATGFIGRHLSKRLIGENYEVICAGRFLGKLGRLLNYANVKAVYLDIEDREATEKIFKEEKPEAVFHCAALVASNSLKDLRRSNVEGTRNVLGACLAAGIKKVIYLSSVAVISGNTEIPLTEGLPYKATNPYGQSKLEAEMVALEYRRKGLEIAILRPCLVYGEDEPHLLPLMVKLIKWRMLPVLGDGSNRLHLVCVDNVVDVMLLCLSKDNAYEGSYFVADKDALTITEVFEHIAKVLKAKPPLHIPKAIVIFFSRFPFIGKHVSFFLKDRVYSIKRLKEELNYTPRVSTYEGLERAVPLIGRGKNSK